MQFSTLKPNVEIIIFHLLLLIHENKNWKKKVQFLHEYMKKYCVELITPHAGFSWIPEMNWGLFLNLRSIIMRIIARFKSRLHLVVDKRVKMHPWELISVLWELKGLERNQSRWAIELKRHSCLSINGER